MLFELLAIIRPIDYLPVLCEQTSITTMLDENEVP